MDLLFFCLSQIIKGSGNKLLHFCIYCQHSFIILCINWSTFNAEVWQGEVPCHLSCLWYSWTAGTVRKAAAKGSVDFTEKVNIPTSHVFGWKLFLWSTVRPCPKAKAINAVLNGQLLVRVWCGWRGLDIFTVLKSFSLRHIDLMIVIFCDNSLDSS